MANLSVNIGKLQLSNPVMTASGTFGYGEEFTPFIDINRLGAYIIKGTTLNHREGNDYPRMVETPSGMLNAVGLQNKGVDYFIEHIYPRICSLGSKLIVNVSGANVDDYAETARRLHGLDDVSAIEVNISCPNVKEGGMAFGTTTNGAAEVTRAVRQAYPDKTLIVKLSPNVTSIADIAKAVEAEGADSVSLINTLLGMRIDLKTRRPVLHNNVGGLSGPAVFPVAVRMVWQVASAVKIPVVGMGGISCWQDAIEMMLAGARAVQIGAALFTDPYTPVRVIEGMDAWLEENGVSDVNEIVGAVRPW